jgi:ATPase family associated with various cellular activities (AAA)
VTTVARDMPADRDQRRLVAELDRLRAVLDGGAAPEIPAEPDARLDRTVALFGLSDFEREVLLWCAGAEVDDRFAAPTFAAALGALPGAHWDAMAPAAPLRYWRLVDVGAGPGLVHRPLRIDERVLHHLIGVTCLDPLLDGLVRPVTGPPGALTLDQAATASELAVRLAARPGRVVARLDGARATARERVAAHAAAATGRLLLLLPADRIPPPGPDCAALARLVEREVALLSALPLVAGDADPPVTAVAAFVAHLGCPVLVAAVPGLPADIQLAVPDPSTADQRALWRAALGESPDVDRLTASFRLQVDDIEAVTRQVADLPSDVLRAARARTRGRLGDLATLIEPAATWADVVLPGPAIETLRDIGRQMAHRVTVYEEWGMAAGSGRGLGVTALFTGESGTGKTLAAEVLAAELDLDLYRVDLAAVVSKYIGETEKNLAKVFDAADASGAVLLFDEADAIFGKRSEVRDSHDRYANLEISFLLQRMETYRGLAILTTNMKAALDRAFLRRIRFVVTFPFPDAAARARIWRLQFPPAVPVDGLDFERLARMQLAGGHIRTVALGAAFLAAAEGEPVGTAHVLTAARREYAKLEKPLTEAEIGGWP